MGSPVHELVLSAQPGVNRKHCEWHMESLLHCPILNYKPSWKLLDQMAGLVVKTIWMRGRLFRCEPLGSIDSGSGALGPPAVSHRFGRPRTDGECALIATGGLVIKFRWRLFVVRRIAESGHGIPSSIPLCSIMKNFVLSCTSRAMVAMMAE